MRFRPNAKQHKKDRAPQSPAPRSARQAPLPAGVPMETLENRRLMSAVTAVSLIDAATDKVVMALEDGAVLNLAKLPSRQLNIRADGDADTKSIRFDLNGSKFRVENEAPFALAGDRDGDYKDWTPSTGNHELVITPYSQTRTGGTQGERQTINFKVIDQPDTGTTPPPTDTAPAAPASLTADTGDDRVVLNWTDRSSNEDGFLVQRSTDGRTYSTVATVAANATGYTDSFVETNTTYHYRVVAFDGTLQSTASNTATVTLESQTEPTPNPAPELGAPKLVLVDADRDVDLFELKDGAVIDFSKLPTKNVNVIAIVGDDVKSVRFGLDGNANYATESKRPLALAGDVGGNYNAWTPADGSHTLTATSLSSSGQAEGAVTVRFTVTGNDSQPTPNPDPTPTAPAAATNLTVSTVSTSQLRLSWKDNATTETGYVVERSTNGTTFTKVATLGANATSYSDAGLSASTKYFYRVTAVNAAGASTAAAANGTTAAQTQTPTPTPTDRPGEHNTGPRAGKITRRHVGNLTVSGGELSGVEITGKLIITGGARVSDVRVLGGNVEVKWGTIEYFEITNPNSGSGLELQDPGGNGERLSVARYGNIHHLSSDGVKIQSHARLEYSWIHHLGMGENSHADGIQARAIGRAVDNVIVRGNFFDMPSSVDHGQKNARPEYSGFRSNAAIYLEGVIGDFLVENNWLNGGNFTVSPGYNGSKVRYINNKFGRDYNWGIRRSISGTVWNDWNWSGNVWMDNGKPTHDADGDFTGK